MRERPIRIVTDSAAQIQADWAAANDVIVLPHRVVIDGKTYIDGVDLSDDMLAEKLLQGASPVQIMAPSESDFAAVYERLANEKVDVLSLHVSSALSETVRNANQAQAKFRGRCNINIIDSKCISLGLNGLVYAAKEMTQSHQATEDVVRRVRGLLAHVYGLFVSANLDHLERSLRLRPAQAELGKMLGVIPCLSLEEGDIVAVEKVRSPERAIERLSEFAGEFDEFINLGVLQLGTPPHEQTRLLLEALQPNVPKPSVIPVWQCGPILGNIIGPAGFGVMIFEGEQ